MKPSRALLATLLAVALPIHAARADEGAPAVTPAEPAAQPAEAPAHKEEFREPGRFGVFAGVTDDGFQFGGVRVGHHYELNVTGDASFTGKGGENGDLGVTLHGGPRVPLTTYNYLSIGAHGHMNFFGKDSGVSTFGSFQAGPYVGLQRHFPGSSLMINVWVLPYAYEQVVGNDGAGEKATVTSHHFFQNGGFGIAYLF
jgi:hypothetical protein